MFSLIYILALYDAEMKGKNLCKSLANTSPLLQSQYWMRSIKEELHNDHLSSSNLFIQNCSGIIPCPRLSSRARSRQAECTPC